MNLFHTIPPQILERMHYLEKIDARDRADGTGRLQRFRQIPPETGHFLALMATLVPPGRWVEIGTSAGYSSLWLALACRAKGTKLTTYEILPEKAALARETLAPMIERALSDPHMDGMVVPIGKGELMCVRTQD